LTISHEIQDVISINDIQIRSQKSTQQLLIPAVVEELKMKKMANMVALVNSGCIQMCIDEQYACKQKWPLLRIPQPIRVQYANRSSNEESTIRYRVDLCIHAAGSVVVTGALVTWLHSVKLFLGHDWLKATNSTINWEKGEIKCEEMRVPLPMQIIEDTTPNYVEEYKTVFSEGEFRGLPPRRKWDHRIDLREEYVPPKGKCYPLAAREKEVLKKFINENLEDKRIRRSNSPYTSPFFFRPKQGMTELRGIQDYQKLNEIMIKD
jgi:hypothetical protein